ncbi:MAG: ABC transporter permease [Candidatus Bathyarchaeia archaeon]
MYLFSITIAAIYPSIFVRIDPYTIDVTKRLLPPCRAHWFGTDDLGRDLFSRVIWGTRSSLLAGVSVALGATIIGTIIGVISGFFSNILDNILMRLTDAFLAFPNILLAIILSMAFGRGLLPAVLALIVSWWPWYARLARAQVLQIKELLFIEAARAVGASAMRILVKHILLNIISPLLVQTTLDIAFAILYTASLSFIGLGAQEPLPEWGAMLNRARAFALTAWWYITFPGLAIFVTVLAINILGDAIRDLYSPQKRYK